MVLYKQMNVDHFPFVQRQIYTLFIPSVQRDYTITIPYCLFSGFRFMT